jgi:hypothetical protein
VPGLILLNELDIADERTRPKSVPMGVEVTSITTRRPKPIGIRFHYIMDTATRNDSGGNQRGHSGIDSCIGSS